MTKNIFFILMFAVSTWFLAVPVQAQDLLSDIEKQNQALAGEKGANLKDADPRLLVAQIIKVLLTVVGITFTAWTFYGGYIIFTSAGEAEKIERAKSIITNGAIGIVVVLASYSIATFFSNMWLKANEDPNEPSSSFWVEPDPDFNKAVDPMGGNTNPVLIPD